METKSCKLQYYHEKVFGVVDKAKNFSDAGLIIKLVSVRHVASVASVGERIFRDLRSETNIPSEGKTSANGENGRLL